MRVVQDHVAAMISAAQLLAEAGATVLEPASHPGPQGLTTPSRRWMRTRLIKRVVAVAAGLLLSLSGLAFAGAFEGSDDRGNDDTTAIVSHQTDVEHQGENSDDQGEDANDQGEDENADDQGDNHTTNDDNGDSENVDDDQGDGGDSQD